MGMISNLEVIREKFSDVANAPLWVWADTKLFPPKSNGKPDKRPLTPLMEVERLKQESADPKIFGVAVNDSSRHGTLPQAIRAAQTMNTLFPDRASSGVGIVLKPKDSIIGIDLDGVLSDDGKLSSAAKAAGIDEIIDLASKANAYIEISQSGRGLHIIGKAEAFKNKCSTALMFNSFKVELYPFEGNHYILLTGRLLYEFDDNDATANLDNVADFIVNNSRAELPAEETSQQQLSAGTEKDFRNWYDKSMSTGRPDEEVLNILRKAKNADKFIRLYDNGDFTGYPVDDAGIGSSEADMALLQLLLFGTGGNAEQTKRLFIASRLAESLPARKGNSWESSYLDKFSIPRAIDQWKKDGSHSLRGKVNIDVLPETIINKLYYSEWTDYGNAIRVHSIYCNEYRYNLDKKAWAHYEPLEGVWKYYDDRQVFPLVTNTMELTIAAINKKTAEQIAAASAEPDDGKTIQKIQAIQKRKEQLIRQAENSRNSKKVESILKMLSSLPDIIIPDEAFDNQPYLINFADCVKNIQTDETLPHKEEFYFTRVTKGRLNVAAPQGAALWDKTLKEILPNNDTRDFFKRAIGSALSGLAEDIFYYLWGKGRNGKGVLMDTIEAAYGTLATSVDPEIYLASRNDGGEKASPQAMKLQNARLISMQEIDSGRYLKGAFFKNATGSGKISKRTLYGKPKEFVVYGKQFLQTNSMPELVNIDRAIEKRLMMIPFYQDFSGAKQDNTIREKLFKQEVYDAIVQWGYEGCLQWVKDGRKIYNDKQGLPLPQEIQHELKLYYAEQDTTQDFIDSCCRVAENDADWNLLSEKRSELWAAFEHYNPTVAGNKRSGPQKRFFKNLEEKGFKLQHDRQRGKVYFGIQLDINWRAKI